MASGSGTGHVGREYSLDRKKTRYRPGIVDARLKIIQRQRQRLVHSMDKLVKKPKQTDAHYKLQKLQDSPKRANLAAGKFRARSVSFETEPNGQINLTTTINRGVPPVDRSINHQDMANTSGGWLPVSRRINTVVDMQQDNSENISGRLSHTVSNDVPTRPGPPVSTQSMPRNPHVWASAEVEDVGQRFIGSTGQGPLRDSSGISKETRPAVQLPWSDLNSIAWILPQLQHQITYLSQQLQRQMNSSIVGAGSSRLMPNNNNNGLGYEHQQPVSRGYRHPASGLQDNDLAQDDVPSWPHGAAGRMRSEQSGCPNSTASTPRSEAIRSNGPGARASIPPTSVDQHIAKSNIQTRLAQQDIWKSSRVGAGGSRLMPNSDNGCRYERKQPVSQGVHHPASRLQHSGMADAEVPSWRYSAAGRMRSGRIGNLDAPAPMPRSMAIWSDGPGSRSTIPPTPVGHQVSVHNPQRGVIQDDVKELVEEKEPLVSSRLERPGDARALYQQRNNAMIQRISSTTLRWMDNQ